MIKTFTEDNYIIRILTAPLPGLEHIVGGQTIGCAHNPEHSYNACPLCAIGNMSSYYWLVGAINRADNQYGIYKLGIGTYRSIASLVKNLLWGNTIEYNLELKGYGGIGYVVLPMAKTPLSEEDKLLKEQVDMSEIERLAAPIPIDRLEKLMTLL